MRMNRVRRVTSPLKSLIAVAALAVVASCSTQADDTEFEAVVAVDVDNPALFAGYIDFETVVAGDLTFDSPYDYYILPTDGGEESLIRAKSPSGDDLALIVLRWNGQGWTRVAANDNCSSTGFDPCLTLTFDEGFYAVLVGTTDYLARRGDPRASYTLRVARVEPTIPTLDEGDMCGGQIRGVCADGLYCDYPDNECGAADVPGLCQRRPDACTQIFEPVCACGAIGTFPNACEAAAAGFDQAPCGFPPPGEFCGGPDDVQCPSGKSCDLSFYRSCGPELSGECVFKEARTCTTIYDPVCGCDGELYPNDCLRRAELVALDPSLEVKTDASGRDFCASK